VHNYYIWSSRLFSYKSLPLVGFEPFTCGTFAGKGSI